MQIELIGCTSAGKSTLTKHIVQTCHQQGLAIFLRDEFVLKQARLDWLKGHLPRTITVDLLAFLACLLTWRHNWPFYRFASTLLFQLPIALPDKLNMCRNALKKIGLYEIISRRDKDDHIILVDEGALQIAHNLFVHLGVTSSQADLKTFAELVPQPDAVIYLRQPESVLIERTVERGHKRIRDRSYQKVTAFIKEAVTTFADLVQIPALKERLLIVDGHQITPVANLDQQQQTIDSILTFIKQGWLMNSKTPKPEIRLPIDGQDVPTMPHSS